MDHQIPSPLLIDWEQLLANLEQIWATAQRTRSRVLLDQTAFPAWPLYPMLGLYLSGTIATDAPLAQQGLRHMDRDSHGVLSPTCSPAELADLLPWCHHLTFSSLEQWQQLGPQAQAKGVPCALQVETTELPAPLPSGISGLRLQLTDPSDLAALDDALAAVEARYRAQLPDLFQFSIAGSLPLTDPAFDLAGLEERLLRFRTRWKLLIYLEVGEAVIRNAVSTLSQPPECPFQAGYPPLYVKKENQIHPFTGF